MRRLTFKQQVLLCVIVMVVDIVLAQITRHGIFHNISWVFYGTVFLLHPVWPQSIDWRDHRILKRGIRIGAVLCIIIGLITKFGV